MSKLERKREYPKRPAQECYLAGVRMTGAAGYKIFKRRDIASLLLCEGTVQGSRVELTLTVPLGQPTRVVLNLSSERADETLLNAEADRMFDLLERELNRSG